MIARSLVAAAMFAATVTVASAATVSDLAQRDDIIPSTTYSLDLGLVDEIAPANVSALLALWNSNGTNADVDPQMTIDFSVNSTFVTTIGLTDISGFSESLNEDVTGFLVDGLNEFTFSINTDFTLGDPATFAVKDFTVTYTEGTSVPAVPLPAAAPLLLVAIAGLGTVARRRRAG